MTKCAPEEVTCPHCQASQTVMLYDTLNVTLDPGLKKEFMAGNINTFTCSSCKEKITVQMSLFYHDMDQHFCAKFIPFEAVFNNDFIREQITSQGQMNFEVPDLLKDNPAFDYFANPHIVFSIDELIRYVIFRERVAIVHARPEGSGAV
jgi:transcription elongation factor Elf1